MHVTLGVMRDSGIVPLRPLPSENVYASAPLSQVLNESVPLVRQR